jgi:mannose/fructose/N-acetylgalactosamine-specific phosphotransferase system component IIC
MKINAVSGAVLGVMIALVYIRLKPDLNKLTTKKEESR